MKSVDTRIIRSIPGPASSTVIFCVFGKNSSRIHQPALLSDHARRRLQVQLELLEERPGLACPQSVSAAGLLLQVRWSHMGRRNTQPEPALHWKKSNLAR
jgi:hypothetical protein